MIISVRASFEASPGCPLGPFQGEVKVLIEADGVTTTRQVVIEGTIVDDVHPIPRMALITLNSDGTGSTTVQLQSYLNRKFAVVKTWSDGRSSLNVAVDPDLHTATDAAYTISAISSNLN